MTSLPATCHRQVAGRVNDVARNHQRPVQALRLGGGRQFEAQPGEFFDKCGFDGHGSIFPILTKDPGHFSPIQFRNLA